MKTKEPATSRRKHYRQTIQELPGIGRAEIVSIIYKKTGLPPKYIRVIMDSLMRVIADHLEQGGKISFRGFGTFYPKENKGGSAYDMFRKKHITKLPHCVPAFVGCPEFKAAVREKVQPTLRRKVNQKVEE